MTTKYTSVEVCELTGASYRQIDYWARKGWIPGQPPEGVGSGNRRQWTAKQIERVELLLRASRVANASLSDAAILLDALDHVDKASA